MKSSSLPLRELSIEKDKIVGAIVGAAVENSPSPSGTEESEFLFDNTGEDNTFKGVEDDTVLKHNKMRMNTDIIRGII